MNNIIIISESNDESTNKILEWLYFYNYESQRINVDDGCFSFSFQINNEQIEHNLKGITIFNRRGYLPTIPKELKTFFGYDYLKSEQFVAIEAFEDVNKNNFIGAYQQEKSNNKILNLLSAKKVGFKIPNTIITNNKKSLLNFIKGKKKYITKSLQYPPHFNTKDFLYYSIGSVEINEVEISEVFAPSLVQEYIEKEIEIRIFFIEDEFFSMAIFSQNDEKTKLDYRKYNHDKPNRYVPYILPNSILNKLKYFVKKIGCNTGSIDLILTPKGEYYFLEINPMGQYDWVSKSCNYYLDKKIVEVLIKKSKNG